LINISSPIAFEEIIIGVVPDDTHHSGDLPEVLGAPMTEESNSGSAILWMGDCISYLFDGLVCFEG
jgi:hypothetical protein